MTISENELLKQQVENLKKQIKILEQRKVIEVTEIGQTMDNPMSNLILSAFDKITSDSGSLVAIYKRMWSFVNYAIICGIGGTAVNYIILSTLVSVLPLIIADVIAILVAAFWNYTFTVGFLGHLSGLAPKKKKEWT